jgi:hypothetical protein
MAAVLQPAASNQPTSEEGREESRSNTHPRQSNNTKPKNLAPLPNFFETFPAACASTLYPASDYAKLTHILASLSPPAFPLSPPSQRLPPISSFSFPHTKQHRLSRVRG